MDYRTDDIPLDAFVLVLMRVDSALARLREVIVCSPLAGMFVERMNILEAAASSYRRTGSSSILQLIHLDAGLEPGGDDVVERQTLVALRTRRRIEAEPDSSVELAVAMEEAIRSATVNLAATAECYSDASFIKAMLSRLTEVKQAVANFPIALRAAILLDAWNCYCDDRPFGWIGSLAVSMLLRLEGCLPHCLAVNVGMKAVASDRRCGPSQTSRLVAFLHVIEKAASFEIKEYNKLASAVGTALNQLSTRRSNSKLPHLLEFSGRRPIVSIPDVVKELGVTPVGARDLIRDLKLREITGRGRDCLWSLT